MSNIETQRKKCLRTTQQLVIYETWNPKKWYKVKLQIRNGLWQIYPWQGYIGPNNECLSLKLGGGMQTLLNINSILVPCLEGDLLGMTLQLTQSVNPDHVKLWRPPQRVVEWYYFWNQQRKIFLNSYSMTSGIKLGVSNGAKHEFYLKILCFVSTTESVWLKCLRSFSWMT